MESRPPTCQALVVFERFTDPARQVLVVAQEEARLLDHHFIGSEHILLGLIRDDGGAAGDVLAETGVSLSVVRERVKETLAAPGGPGQGSPPFTPRAKKVLELALRDALQLGADYIGTEHLLLGLLREGEGVGAQILSSLGVTLSEVRQRVIGKLAGVRREGGSGVQGLRAAGSRMRPTEARVVACSFCGLHPPESGELIAGDNAFICEHCISRWSLRLARSGPVGRGWIGRAPSNQVAPGEPPVDPDRAKAAISTAFAIHGAQSDDGVAALGVEGGTSLGWALDAAKRNRPTFLDSEIAFTVDDITFVDTEHAAVWYSIFVDGNPVLSRRRGDAVLICGEWLMARSTFCQIMAMGGVTVPPE